MEEDLLGLNTVLPQRLDSSSSFVLDSVPTHAHTLLEFDSLQTAGNSSCIASKEDGQRTSRQRQLSTIFPPSELLPSLSSGTMNTRSTITTLSSGNAAYLLDDQTCAPRPPLPTWDQIVRFDFMAEKEVAANTIPMYEKVMHAGSILSRISVKSVRNVFCLCSFFFCRASSFLPIFVAHHKTLETDLLDYL